MSNLDVVGLPKDFISEGTWHLNVKALADDPEVLARAARDQVPIPPPFQRINYYGDDHFGYWLSGLADVRQLRRLLDELSLKCSDPILDFGASSGRVARHWGMEPENFEVYACDITRRMVDWMDVHLVGRVNATVTAPKPPLPYKSGMFGLIYAYSVFSHIFYEEDDWLQELRRVVCPNGLLALTVHNESTWALLPNLKFRIRDQLAQNADYVALRSRGSIMPDRVQFIQAGVSYSFYSNAHIRAVWGKHFDVVRIEDAFHNYQSMVILRRRD